MDIKYLRIIKILDITLTILIALIYALTEWFVFCLLLGTIVWGLSWYYYRCPHCQMSLDLRTEISGESYCPYCGKNLHL